MHRIVVTGAAGKHASMGILVFRILAVCGPGESQPSHECLFFAPVAPYHTVCFILQYDSLGLLVEVLTAVLNGAVPSQCSLAFLRPSRRDWEGSLDTARVFRVYVNVSYHLTLLRPFAV